MATSWYTQKEFHLWPTRKTLKLPNWRFALRAGGVGGQVLCPDFLNPHQFFTPPIILNTQGMRTEVAFVRPELTTTERNGCSSKFLAIQSMHLCTRTQRGRLTGPIPAPDTTIKKPRWVPRSEVTSLFTSHLAYRPVDEETTE